jgi:singapore isolate B (sub-type 7) whole genome shotgun sequence assembly, scaffold_10
VGDAMVGCLLNSQKQMEAYYVNSPSKRTKLVSKLTIDFTSRMSEMQIGCLYLFKSGKLHMALTSSGHLQTFIVETDDAGEV